MICPVCGNENDQLRLGELYDRPLTVYHCQACDELYAIKEPDAQPDGEEE